MMALFTKEWLRRKNRDFSLDKMLRFADFKNLYYKAK